jgi:drug/metabolite transporter (DMT)-like permease
LLNPNSDKRLLGAACMIASAFFFALLGVGVKLAGDELGVWQISFYRAIVGILIMLVMAAVLKVKLLGPNLKLLSIRGLSGTVGFLSMIVALRQIPLAEVMVIFYLFPVFAALFSPWINNERIASGDWLFIAIAFAGTVVIMAPGGGIELKFGHLCAMVLAVFAGLNTSLVRRLSSDHTPYAIYLFFCLAALVVSIGPLALGEESLIPSGTGLLYLAAIGVVATIGQVLMNQGFYYLPATEGGVVLMSQVIIAAAWGVLFFGEPLTWRLVLGGVLIMAGGAFLNRASRKRAALKEAE